MPVCSSVLWSSVRSRDRESGLCTWRELIHCNGVVVVKSSALPEGTSLVDLLRRRADERGEALLYRFLEQGEAGGACSEWSFAELDRRARRAAA
jgi:hypothetical protein